MNEQTHWSSCWVARCCKLMDSMKAGIGSMVDADMEEASARLQALQTQQQLGIQSLSIANQAPGAVMALFR